MCTVTGLFPAPRFYPSPRTAEKKGKKIAKREKLRSGYLAAWGYASAAKTRNVLTEVPHTAPCFKANFNLFRRSNQQRVLILEFRPVFALSFLLSFFHFPSHSTDSPLRRPFSYHPSGVASVSFAVKRTWIHPPLKSAILPGSRCTFHEFSSTSPETYPYPVWKKVSGVLFASFHAIFPRFYK